MYQNIIISLIFCFVWCGSLFSQAYPLLGYVDKREACVLVHTNDLPLTSKNNQIIFEYWPHNEPKNRSTLTARINKEVEPTHHFILKGLEPGTPYEYAYTVPKTKFRSQTYRFTTQSLWEFRTDPPPLRVATGSCAFINEPQYDRPGKPYGSDYFIFDTIVTKKPDMMLWLGDNIYLREVDYGCKSGIEHRYNHTRAQGQMEKLLSACPNYAIWDDHDFGPNDAIGSYVHKDWTLEAFKTFWANPSYGLSGSDGGITSHIRVADIDFFLLDNRYWRTSAEVVNAEKPTILGETQINWLIQSLKTSDSPFKMVAIGGQFLSTNAKYENYAVHSAEKERIIKLIEDNNIKGVIFLTGDRHCTELSELTLSNGNKIYDLTVSPLTSGAYDNTKEPNTLRVDGTIVPKANFATLDFSGKRKERQLKVTVYDNHGVEQWSKILE